MYDKRANRTKQGESTIPVKIGRVDDGGIHDHLSVQIRVFRDQAVQLPTMNIRPLHPTDNTSSIRNPSERLYLLAVEPLAISQSAEAA